MVSMGENANAVISNIYIRIRKMWLLLLDIRIRITRLLSASAQLLHLFSAYEVIDILNYYLNLYARLNNAIITIYKLK
jgi:hypothetical protein